MQHLPDLQRDAHPADGQCAAQGPRGVLLAHAAEAAWLDLLHLLAQLMAVIAVEESLLKRALRLRLHAASSRPSAGCPSRRWPVRRPGPTRRTSCACG